jgi:L-lactate utilization protein LutB
MNHCPVYQKIGGHAYGWVYPGPMGSVLTPSFKGLDKALDLPQAATLCGECNSVCPVGIPLSDLLRKLREKQMERGLRPFSERAGLAVWSFLAMRPALYALVTKIAVRVLEWRGGERRLISKLPMGGGWFATRDIPAPVGRTFRELYKQQKSH